MLVVADLAALGRGNLHGRRAERMDGSMGRGMIIWIMHRCAPRHHMQRGEGKAGEHPRCGPDAECWEGEAAGRGAWEGLHKRPHRGHLPEVKHRQGGRVHDRHAQRALRADVGQELAQPPRAAIAARCPPVARGPGGAMPMPLLRR
eukprot:364695-Chlamydomonas_euryale.AAC.6